MITQRKMVDDLAMATHAPVTEAEQAWVDVLRAIFPAGVPGLTLRRVQALRMALSGREIKADDQGALILLHQLEHSEHCIYDR